MPILIGIALATGVAIFAHSVGFDRDRSFYPVVLIVIAALYVLFAAMAGPGANVTAELIPFALFAGLAIAGFRRSLWLVVAGLALHGVFDFLRGPYLPNSGVPSWWPDFCAAYDIAAAAALAMLLLLSRQTGSRGLPGSSPA